MAGKDHSAKKLEYIESDKLIKSFGVFETGVKGTITEEELKNFIVSVIVRPYQANQSKMGKNTVLSNCIEVEKEIEVLVSPKQRRKIDSAEYRQAEYL